MALSSTAYRYVSLDDNNTAMIEGTSMKVVELITSVKAYRWDPQTLLENYPHLTLAKIHSALAYYWDHQGEIDADIQDRQQVEEQLRQEARESGFAARMREQGLLG